MILGGGPAGAATALALLRSGRTVAVLERTHYESTRIGETLPPESRRLLQALDVVARFERDHHVPSPGIISLWGSPIPVENAFIFNPFGLGWHVDRSRFDRMLVSAAEERGANVHLDVRVSVGPIDGRARCSVLARTDAEAWAYTCDHVVDATGRSPLPFGPRRGRAVSDPLAAIVGFGSASRPLDGRTILEAAERGWWYCANLPDGRVVTTFVTDPSLVGRDYTRLFHDEVRKTAVAASYAARADEMTIGVVNCSSYLRSPVVTKGWVAVGDAASAYDPLSSLGICKALESGIRAADALARNRLDEYEAWVRSSFEQYVRTRDAYYALETRWPDSPFWRARRGERA